MTCPKCGEVLAEGATTCSFCGEAVNPTQTQPTNPENPVTPAPEEEKEENVVRGAIGALIGALLGGAAIVLLYYMGYVAALGGLLLAFCALKGYELLGGKLSTKGIIISLVFILIMPAIAYFLYETLVCMQDMPGATLGQALEYVIYLVQNYAEVQSIVIKNLLTLYGFTALGAVSLVINAFKKKK